MQQEIDDMKVYNVPSDPSVLWQDDGCVCNNTWEFWQDTEEYSKHSIEKILFPQIPAKFKQSFVVTNKYMIFLLGGCWVLHTRLLSIQGSCFGIFLDTWYLKDTFSNIWYLNGIFFTKKYQFCLTL